MKNMHRFEEKDIDINVQWGLFGNIKTKGHQMLDGSWYIFLPLDMDWHFVPNSDVTLIN